MNFFDEIWKWIPDLGVEFAKRFVERIDIISVLLVDDIVVLYVMVGNQDLQKNVLIVSGMD